MLSNIYRSLANAYPLQWDFAATHIMIWSLFPHPWTGLSLGCALRNKIQRNDTSVLVLCLGLKWYLILLPSLDSCHHYERKPMIACWKMRDKGVLEPALIDLHQPIVCIFYQLPIQLYHFGRPTLLWGWVLTCLYGSR